MFDAKPMRSPTKVMMIPSVSGGIGHISRTATLARTLQKLDPQVEIEFLLDIARLRPFNIDATRRMGYRPRFLPLLTRGNRDAAIRACMDDIDIVVDDCARYLVPLRRAVPNMRWVTLAMHPVRDELFMDWPMMEQMDGVIWPYAPLVALPSELDGMAGSIVKTGPFLEIDDVPDRAGARAQLGLPIDAPFVLYAPRGFPFGAKFGHRVLSGAFEAVQTLRRGRHPGLRLVLLAVNSATELREAGLPEVLPEWVTVKGVVTPAESLLYTRAASVVIGEGTSTMHEAAALRTPLVAVPGPITEAMMLAEALGRERAATLFTPPRRAKPRRFADAFDAALTDGAARDTMVERAHALITGGGGVDAAARLVLDIVDRHRAAQAGGSAEHPESASAHLHARKELT